MSDVIMALLITFITRHSAILDGPPQLALVNISRVPNSGAQPSLHQRSSHHAHVTRVGLLLAFF